MAEEAGYRIEWESSSDVLLIRSHIIGGRENRR